MKLVQFMKPLADLSFIYGMLGTLLAMAFPLTTSLIPLFIMAAIQLLGYLLQGKSYRFVALIPAVLLLLFIGHWVDFILIAISLAYLFLAIKREGYFYNSPEEIDHFRSQIVFFPILIFFGYLLGASAIINSYTLPKVFLYLVVSNLLLRTLRADPETMETPSFTRFNMITIVIVGIFSMMLSYQPLIDAIVSGVSYVYFTFIGPGFLALLSLFIWALSAIATLFYSIFNGSSEGTFSMSGMMSMNMETLFEGKTITEVEPAEWLVPLIVTILSIVALILLILLFRRMFGRIKGEAKDTHVMTEAGAGRGFGKGERFSLFLTPREKVRKTYVDFMNHAVEEGVILTVSTDTGQLELMYGPTQDTEVLTRHYRSARYDPVNDINKTQIDEAKQAVKAIKIQRKKENNFKNEAARASTPKGYNKVNATSSLSSSQKGGKGGGRGGRR